MQLSVKKAQAILFYDASFLRNVFFVFFAVTFYNPKILQFQSHILQKGDPQVYPQLNLKFEPAV